MEPDMDAGLLNSWLGIVANLGVVVGLVLVALQIRQNTQITKAQVANDWFLADMQLELAMMGENPAFAWTKAIVAPDDLDPHEAAVLDRYFNFGLVQIQRLQKMHELGVADAEWMERASYLSWHLGNEVGRRWWSHFRGGFPEEFAGMVDGILEAADEGRNAAALQALRGGPRPADGP
jgi:hypothetical protein